MDNRMNILSMLGLALRGNRLAVGEEPVESVARARDARVLLLASDASDNTRRRCRHFAEAGQCLWLTIPYTKAELGQATGRSSVAIAALTDVGMAASFVHKLAALDPKKYAEAAERLDVKAKRAAERKSEMQAHEKNLRQGKRKSHKESPAHQEPVEKAAPAEDKKKTASPRKPYSSRGSQQGRNAQRHSDGWKPRDGESRPGNKERRSPYGSQSGSSGGSQGYSRSKSRPSKENRPKPRAKFNPYAHSLPVKKGKGSFRKRED